MPVRGYRSISVREDLYDDLIRLMDELRMVSMNDVIAFLLSSGKPSINNFEVAYLKDKVAELEDRLNRLEESLRPAQQTPKPQEQKKRKTIREIIAEHKLERLSDLNVKNPEKFIEKARAEGVVVLEGVKDTALVDPDFFEDFKRKIEELNTNDESNLVEKLGGDGIRLLNFMRENGLIYFDTEQKWRFLL